MRTEIDKENWVRKEQFEFFNTFEEPYWGLTANVDCTIAYRKAKEKNYSFFLYYLFKSLKTVNHIDELKMRVVDEKIYLYDIINASPVIDRDNGTFGFARINYYADIEKFMKEAKEEVKRVRNMKGLFTCEEVEDVVHYSTIPWISFTSLSHARPFSVKDYVPKITFGKFFIENNNKLLPVSVHVNHSLVDGFHVGKFYELFQNFLDE